MRSDDIYTLLEQLGDDADEIADRLDQRGIRGDQTCGACPLAVYLARQSVPRPYVAAAVVFWGDHEQWIDLPRGAHAFVANFDMGRYPELMAEV